MMNRPPIINVIGYSNSGKTRCIVELVSLLTRRGYTVATAKHCHEGFNLDVKGKDTWKHKQAGAIATLMSGGKQIAVIKDAAEPIPLEIMARQYMPETDLLLAEGFKSEGHPKILVIKGAYETGSSSDESIFAFVSDEKLDALLPQFSLSELEPLASLIERRFLLSVKLAGREKAAQTKESIDAPCSSFLSLLKRHDQLNELFLSHQEYLMAAEVEPAFQTLQEYEKQLRAHMLYEEDVLLPVYARAGRIQGGAVEFFTGEHKKMLGFIGRFIEALNLLKKDPANFNRQIIKLFDAQAAFKQLVEHHDQREQNILYPTLDKITDEVERQGLLDKQA